MQCPTLKTMLTPLTTVITTTTEIVAVILVMIMLTIMIKLIPQKSNNVKKIDRQIDKHAREGTRRALLV